MRWKRTEQKPRSSSTAQVVWFQLVVLSALAVGSFSHAAEPTCRSGQPCFRALSDPSAPWAIEPSEVLLTVAHLTDTHVGKVPHTPKGPVDDAEAFEAVIRSVNALSPRPDLTLITGDLTDAWKDTDVRRFKKLAFEGLKTPVLVAAGNHDVGFDPQPSNMTSWKRHFPEATWPQVTEKGPFVFIGFDSQVYNAKRKRDAVDELAEAQWGRLVKAVTAAKAKGKQVVLFHHIPALPNFFRKKVKASWKGKYLTRYLALLETQKVEFSLTGHFHRDEFYVRGDTLFLNAPPVSRWETRDTSYRVLRFTRTGVVYRQIYVGPEARQRSYEVDLRGLTREGFDPWVQGLDARELRTLWERRYAGDDASERLYRDLRQRHFRAFLTDPFSYQPADDGTRYLTR